jgi:hypothetical protein
MGAVPGRSTQSLAVMTRMLAALALLATLTGCYPYVASYVHLAASESGVSYVPVCGNAGPPVYAKYERNGVRFTVTLESAVESGAIVGFLRLAAPPHAAISIPDPIGYVARNDKSGEPALRFELRPAEYPKNQNRITDETLARIGVYRFDFAGLPPITFSGTLKLPTVFVDGVAVTSPVFEFERRSYAGVVPFNC